MGTLPSPAQVRQSFTQRVMNWLGPVMPAAVSAGPSREEVLVALIMDDIRSNPTEWTKYNEYSATGIRNRKTETIVSANADKYRYPSLYGKAIPQINDVVIKLEEFDLIMKVFAEKFVNQEIEKFIKRRLARVAGSVEEAEQHLQLLGISKSPELLEYKG